MLVKQMMDRETILAKHLLKVWDKGSTSAASIEANTLDKIEFFGLMYEFFGGEHPDLWESDVSARMHQSARISSARMPSARISFRAGGRPGGWAGPGARPPRLNVTLAASARDVVPPWRPLVETFRRAIRLGPGARPIYPSTRNCGRHWSLSKRGRPRVCATV